MEKEAIHMTKYSLLKELKALKNTNREHLIKASKLVLKDQATFQSLVEIAFEYENELSIKALWVVEHICEQRMDLLAMNFIYFVKNVSNLTDESSIRAGAKICSLIAQNYNTKFDSAIELVATKSQISQLIEICFKWLQNDYKVAAKAHAMEALYQLGKQMPWIHYELKLILEKILYSESPGFQIRASKILESISNYTPLHKV